VKSTTEESLRNTALDTLVTIHKLVTQHTIKFKLKVFTISRGFKTESVEETWLHHKQYKQEGDHSEDQGVDGRTGSEWILGDWLGGCGLDSTGSG
jgi:hypothetical protein